MNAQEAQELLDSLMERLAAIEHERWAHWQRYMHERASKQPDGSLLIPAHLAKHWERQLLTSYSELSDKEKESDREQVRKYLPVIAEALSKR